MVDSVSTARQQVRDESQLPEYLTIDEWRRIMRLGRSKAYDLVRTNSIPHIRFGKIIRIPRSALQVSQ